MSESPIEIDSEREAYAYRITRKLFVYTIIGTVLFAGIIIGLWYVF